MKKDMEQIPGTNLLREKAEEKLYRKDSGNRDDLSEMDTIKLVHELEVHQVELEMQLEELQKARNKAEIANERFTTLYDFAPAGYFTVDRDGVISELNLTGAKMLGMGRFAVMNRRFSQFITRGTLPLFDNFLFNVFDSNPKAACDVALNMDGEPTSYLHMEGMTLDSENKCQITAIDISDSKRAEELRISEMRYRRLFESAQDGILIIDAVNQEIVDVNPGLIQMLGYSFDELLGKHLWEIGIFKNIGESKMAFVELQKLGSIRIDDIPLQTKNGDLIIVEFVCSVYSVDHYKVIQCNFRDITQRKRAEESLKESEQRLRELNATKDKFFSIIAHDLKSPFNAINGFCDLLVMQMKEKDYQGIDKYASIILDSSQRAMDLLINLLEWSRSQTGNLSFHPESIDLNALIRQVTAISNDTALQKSISIDTHLPDKVMVFADKDMLNAIFRNLISNAIKFTHQGGKIVISVDQELDSWKVTIADNGVGIKNEVVDKLFRMDANHKTAGTNNEMGTGLGLLLCKEFIDKHGAKIWVESEVGIGSKFYFTIPGLPE